jgi:hypothetical protein
MTELRPAPCAPLRGERLASGRHYAIRRKAPLLRAMRVEPVVVDVFDAVALRGIMADVRPEVVISRSRARSRVLAPAAKLADAARSANAFSAVALVYGAPS